MPRRRLTMALLAVLVAAALLAATRALTAQTAPEHGTPLPGLPAPLLAAFEEGRQRFVAEETPASGLGPVFNARSCVACHSVPVAGGSATSRGDFGVRFGRQGEGRPFDPLLAHGGPVLQRRSVGDELPGCTLPGEVVPPEADAVGVRQPLPLFGLGLIQAIPDTTILAGADPADADGDGIAGRANVGNAVIGRFGWKAAVATVADFVGLALVSELGVTNFLYPNETSPQGRPIPPPCKVTLGLEDADASRLAGITAFLSFMSPPPRGPITEAVLRGERLFAQAGCASCHTPVMRTGPSDLAALDQVEVPLYSDLLTHYMGPALDDGLPEGAVGGGRWRTAPLWGLRARRFFLHDGRTPDLVTAIRLHGGEARAARDRFLGLGAAAQGDLLAFLRSL